MVSLESQSGGVATNRGKDIDILRSFSEWLKVQEARVDALARHPDGLGLSDRRDDEAGKEFHLSPHIAATRSSIDERPHLSSNGPSLGRRVFRIINRGFIIIALVGAVVAWQSYADDTTKHMVGADIARAWEVSLSWISSLLAIESHPSSVVAHTSASETSDQERPSDSVIPQPAHAAQPAAGLATTPSSPELQHQLDTMASDLAIVRRTVEQLAAKQDQMAQDIATLQAAEQEIGQKISSVARPVMNAAPHKSVSRIAQPEAAPRSTAAVPLPRPAPAPLPLR